MQIDVRVAVGEPAEEIVRVAGEEEDDLIIMGTHGHTGLHDIFRSTVEVVFYTAPCPVFMVRSSARAVR